VRRLLEAHSAHRASASSDLWCWQTATLTSLVLLDGGTARAYGIRCIALPRYRGRDAATVCRDSVLCLVSAVSIPMTSAASSSGVWPVVGRCRAVGSLAATSS
jgi:hypothetical protein